MKKPRISDLPNLPSASLPICQVTDLENGDDDINDDDDDDDDDGDDNDIMIMMTIIWPKLPSVSPPI